MGMCSGGRIRKHTRYNYQISHKSMIAVRSFGFMPIKIILYTHPTDLIPDTHTHCCRQRAIKCHQAIGRPTNPAIEAGKSNQAILLAIKLQQNKKFPHIFPLRKGRPYVSHSEGIISSANARRSDERQR